MSSKTIDELIDEIVEEGLAVGPDAITSLLLDWLDKPLGEHHVDMDEELPRLIRVYVSVRLSQRRNRPHKLPDPEPELATRRSGRPLSAKVAAIRRAAPAWLEEQVALGRKSWKRLGDLTQDDLSKLAGKRLSLADDHREKAQVYLAWADRMREHHVNLLRELPDHVLNGDPR